MGNIQANNIYSAEIKGRIKGALLPGAGTGHSYPCSRARGSGGIFFYRATDASAVFAFVVCPSIRLSVCPSEAGIVLKLHNESSWFWRGGFLPPVSHCFQEISVLPRELFAKLPTPDTPTAATPPAAAVLQIVPWTDRRRGRNRRHAECRRRKGLEAGAREKEIESGASAALGRRRRRRGCQI